MIWFTATYLAKIIEVHIYYPIFQWVELFEWAIGGGSGSFMGHLVCWAVCLGLVIFCFYGRFGVLSRWNGYWGPFFGVIVRSFVVFPGVRRCWGAVWAVNRAVLGGIRGDFGGFSSCFVNSLTLAFWSKVSDLSVSRQTFSGPRPNFGWFRLVFGYISFDF